MSEALREFQNLARDQYAAYARDCRENDIEDLGIVLFLDTGFGSSRSRIACLGINPGGSKPAGEDGLRQPGNDEPRIWNGRRDGQANRRFERYWANTRDMLIAAANVQDGLEERFDHAFFGNVYPFRSPKWSSAPNVQKALMRKYGAPITRFLFERGLYDTVICIGPDAVHALAYHAKPMIFERSRVCRTFPAKSVLWPRRCADHVVHCHDGKTIRLLEVPQSFASGEGRRPSFRPVARRAAEAGEHLMIAILPPLTRGPTRAAALLT